MHFGNVSVDDGSKRKPSFTFIDDPDSGLYLVSPGVIGVVINGVEVSRFTSTGINPAPLMLTPAWTITAFTADRAFAGDSTTAADAVKGLASLVNDLITLGIIPGSVAA